MSATEGLTELEKDLLAALQEAADTLQALSDEYVASPTHSPSLAAGAELVTRQARAAIARAVEVK